jgi:hypothetical protein
LDQLVSSPAEIYEITNAVAIEANQQGLYEDAIDLFDAAQNYEQVLAVICDQLSRAMLVRDQRER